MKVKRSFTKSLSGLGLGGLAGIVLSGPMAWSSIEGLPQNVAANAIDGEYSQFLCPQDRAVELLDDTLTSVVLSVSRPEQVKVMQSFSGEDTKSVGSTIYRRVQLPGAGLATGWVDEEQIVAKSKCAGAEVNDEGEMGAASADDQLSTLSELPTWSFPTIARPSANYKEGMRRFGAARASGRLHAACDLYRNKDEKAVAVAAGKVVRSRYAFYEGTYAIEVQHAGGRIVRYGEITGKTASGTSKGRAVKLGQVVGYVAKVNSGCCEPMLHFEMYTGKATGTLTQRKGSKYQRRKDLMDPSALLTTWEKQKFGQSY